VGRPKDDELYDPDVTARADALEAWQDDTLFCAQCGARLEFRRGHDTLPIEAHCPECGEHYFPRIDPAVIVAITNAADELFLGHQNGWGNNRVSLLAGFVEAGESAEEAVVRELFEEAKLVVSDVVYVTSQSWPYPKSLMLGFTAYSDSPGEVDHEEIEWGGWYSRQRLRDALDSGEVTIPGPGRLSRVLIDAWLDREL
jgi:NAD+ diphosphatase